MILDDLKELKRGSRELRRFGLMVGSVFVLLGLLLLWRGRGHPAWFLSPGAVLVTAGALVPKILEPIYIIWMALAFVLGFVVSSVLLTAFFFLVITPIGLVARLLGKDFLRLKLDPRASSYWLSRTKPSGSSADYERQF